MDVRYFILLLLFLISCQPAPKLANTKVAAGSTTANDGTIPTSALSWNYLNALSTQITINIANLNNAYIVGSQVEYYLKALSSDQLVSENYCLVSKFSIAGVTYQHRARVVPVSYYDFQAKRTVRVLRVDFQDVINAADTCRSSYDLYALNSSGAYQLENSTNIRLDPATLCTGCTSNITASSVRLFHLNANKLEQIPSTAIPQSLGLSINPNNNTSGGSPTSCTSSSCAGLGYDCCLDNQCVKDGATKPAASSQYPNELLVAEEERLQNPLAYLNYPQLYYICGSSVPGTTTGTSGGGYDAAFEALKKDYACVNAVKTASPSTPFHLDLLNTALYAGIPAATCAASGSMYYQRVMERLYNTCGCSKTSLSEMMASCPAYEYEANNTTNPTVINCYTPPTGGTGGVPNQQTVSLNSRTAPHRYFNSLGVESVAPAGTQEGNEFSYQDTSGLFPLQTSLSMNAILGQMTVALDQALPAKQVTVNLDQIYLLSTTSGYYTPCPTCSKDMWFSTLSPFPVSQYGTGLQTIGHTTTRDALGTNTTGGNYEDTIFGRACWLPPTMIPFSHILNSDVTTQRKNRLTAQAALFANGYQRDWFGFNKGALIGSFDGVTWFAVGKGRIVKATSTKLFLAINAPFADLASPTIHSVNVQAYDGTAQAASVDYDPTYHLSHALQNEAGNCQANHFCDTDTDCVTRLGWEYMCADVRDLKTNWPQFNPDSTEKSSSVATSIDQILAQKSFPSSSTKRCVYRGAGAICTVNAGSIVDLNKKKTLTCAPNFFCSNLNNSNFNGKIARFSGNLEDVPTAGNHFFGKDANVLGRPLNYVTGNESLGTAATSLRTNITLNETASSSNTGLCLPGKFVPESGNEITNPFTQQMYADSSRRTDFISQIAGCNSNLFTASRHSSCPVIDATTGNYEMFATATILTGYNLRARNQNACGLETLLNNTSPNQVANTLSTFSPFKNIEAKPLNQQVINTPTLARDACLRRAGQVCNTDLDCSPNKYHAEQVDYFSATYFGNEAEKRYYSEYLVCGQGDPKPLPSDTLAFKNYKMNLNRCCREVGAELSTYSSDVPTAAAENTYLAGTVGLKMSVAPGIAPSDPKRYTRLATVESLGASVDRPYLSGYHDRNNTTGAIELNTLGVNAMTANQWKTLGEANSESCCGGGWIRKFTDGGTDWSRRDRVLLDVNNFKCLNARSPLLIRPELFVSPFYNSTGDVQTLVNQDYGDYCKDGLNVRGSCAQYSFTDSTSTTILPSNDPTSPIVVNTVKPNFTAPNLDYFFAPRSADSDPLTYIDYASTVVGVRRNITIRIPSYITRASFDLVEAFHLPGFINMIAEDTSIPLASCSYEPSIANLAGSSSEEGGAVTCGADCCYHYEPSTRILKVIRNNGYAPFNGKKVGVTFTAATVAPLRKKPANNTYYLSRLGKLELSGIPQVAVEPLYCSDDSTYLVPGIFKSALKKDTDFNSNAVSFVSGFSRYASYHTLEQESVFSPNDFKCCTPLGKTTKTASTCCSGYGVSNGTTEYTCKLPAGADLMVYFNRFVSNEGRAATTSGDGLVDADFNPQTGEPLISTTVIQKLQALGSDSGSSFCWNGKVRQGGAFGAFEPEPVGPDSILSNRIYNIVDSSRDAGTNPNAGQTVSTGYNAFMSGFRWNHHLYCDD